MANQESTTPRPDGPQGPFKMAGLPSLGGDPGDGPRRLYFERGEEWYAQFAPEDVVDEWSVPDNEPPFYEGEKATVVELAPGAHVDYVLSTEVSGDQFDPEVRVRTTAAPSAGNAPPWRCFSHEPECPFHSRGMRYTCFRC